MMVFAEWFRYTEATESAMEPQRPANPGINGMEVSRCRPLEWTFPFRWPERLLGPRPGLRGFAKVCWGFFFGTLVIPLCLALWMRLRQTAACDFVYFYGVGQIIRNFPHTSLYDLGLQLKTFNAIAPPLSGFYGPSPYPPFVAQFFSLFARLPFVPAFLLWMAASLGIYIYGVSLVIKEAFPREDSARSLALCIALAFPPFILNTLANGQIASIACFSICLTVFLERRERPIASGFALSILAYKPTLLIVIFPMLFITRRLKTLLGFFAGVILLFLEATAVDGAKIWPAYLHFLLQFKLISQKAGVGVSPAQFVDLNSLSYGIPGGRSMLVLAVFVAVAVAAAAWLASLLWRSSRFGRPAQSMAWATTLTWTLLLNVYVPMYDSALAVVALILTIAALNELELDEAASWILLSAVLILAVSWVTEPIARRSGVQLLTILLFVFGAVQFGLLGGLCRDRKLKACSNAIVAGQ